MQKQRYTDIEIIENYMSGRQESFTWFYAQSRPIFFRHFEMEKNTNLRRGALQYQKFKRDGSFIEDLFHTSLEVLCRKILNEKLFVKDGKIYATNKKGEQKLLTSSLYQYLQGIGNFTLMTIERNESFIENITPEEIYSSFDDVEYTSGIPSEDDEYSTDDVDGSNIIHMGQQGSTSSEDDEDMEDEGYTGGFCTIAGDEDLDEYQNRKILAVSEVVRNMKEPCKSIFKFTFYMEDGKKLSDAEIAEMIPGIKNADSVKSTRQRCNKKFRTKFEEVFGTILGLKEKK